MENTPQYRGWEMASNIMGLRLSNTTEMLGIAGAVGEAAAAEFCGFLRHWRELVNPEDVWADPSKVKVPTEASALYAVVSKVASEVTPEHLPQMIKYVKRCGPEYKVMAYFDVLRICNSKKDKSLVANKDFVAWSASPTITAALKLLQVDRKAGGTHPPSTRIAGTDDGQYKPRGATWQALAKKRF